MDDQKEPTAATTTNGSSTMKARDESLRCRPGKTPTWRNRLHQKDADWAEMHWWNPIYLAFFNVLIVITIVPLNVAILLVVAWPIVLLHYYLKDEQQLLLTYGFLVAVLVGKIIALYFQHPDNDLENQKENGNINDDMPAPKQKVVAIIGAGPAGLVVAKELLAEGHVPIVLEQAGVIGGVWQKKETAENSSNAGHVLPHTRTSSSALNTAFSDFPIQAEYPGPDPFFATQQDYMEYVHRYAKYFDVIRHVRLRTKVVSVSKIEEGNDQDRWRVETESATDKKSRITTMDVDAVVVCSGQTSTPKRMEIKGQDKFKGKILHSSDLRDLHDFGQFKGKRVLVIGAGETASDALGDVSNVAAKCDVSIRNPVLVLPRNLWGAPPDYTEPRTLYLPGRFSRWATYKLMNLPSLFWNAFARQYRGKTIWIPSDLWILKLLITPKLIRESIQGKRSACASIQTTKSDTLLYVLQDKGDKCKLRSEVISTRTETLFSMAATKVTMILSSSRPGSSLQGFRSWARGLTLLISMIGIWGYSIQNLSTWLSSDSCVAMWAPSCWDSSSRPVGLLSCAPRRDHYQRNVRWRPTSKRPETRRIATMERWVLGFTPTTWLATVWGANPTLCNSF